MSTSSAPGAPRGRNVDRNVDRSSATSAPSGRSDGIDLAVAVDLVVVHRGLNADEAHELLCRHAEATGRDLDDVASDVIDLGTSRLPR